MAIENIKKQLDRYWPVNAAILLLAGFLLYVAFTAGDLAMFIVAVVFIVVELLLLLVVGPLLQSHDYPLNLRFLNYVKMNYPWLLYGVLLLYVIIQESSGRFETFSDWQQSVLNGGLTTGSIILLVLSLRKRKEK